jgi:hypothetical protein
MELKINVANPEAITYQTEELGFTILGGIRIDGLDRLRVTMKIEVINRQYEHYLNNPDIANLAIRHNLDLYNDVQVEKLIRKTAERLEVGSTSLTKPKWRKYIKLVSLAQELCRRNMCRAFLCLSIILVKKYVLKE